jgi:hypothetical protein
MARRLWMLTGVIWLKIRSRGGLFRTRYSTFGLHRSRRIRLSERLLTFKEGYAPCNYIASTQERANFSLITAYESVGVTVKY